MKNKIFSLYIFSFALCLSCSSETHVSSSPKNGSEKLCIPIELQNGQSSLSEILKKMKFLPGEKNPGQAFFEPNIVLQNCSSYSKTNELGLTEDLYEGLIQGVECLSKFGDERRLDAERLVGLFQDSYRRPVTITCGKIGEVLGTNINSNKVVTIKNGATMMDYGCDVGKYPALAINLSALERRTYSANELQGILFHEMTHWLGYRHFKGFDVPYLAEICCFKATGRNQKMRGQACDLLRRNPNWTSVDYQTSFARIMDEDGSTVQGLQSVWDSTFKSQSTVSMGKLDATALFTSALAMGRWYPSPIKKEQWRVRGYAILPIIFAGASLRTFSKEQLEKSGKILDSKIRNFYYPQNDKSFLSVRKLMGLLELIVSGPLGGASIVQILEAWDEVKAIEKNTCSELTPNELTAIKNVVQISGNSFFEISKPQDLNFRFRWAKFLTEWHRLCEL